VDGRTDEYSLAAVLYEMLTGEPPFPGRSLEAVVARRLSDPTPSAPRLRDDLPANGEEPIRKAMARAPADRFGTVTEFAQALQAPTRDASPVPAAGVTPG